jgi:hypothetical protein
MASTDGSLRQRVALRSAIARLRSHSAWLHAAMPVGQSWLGGCAAKWITTQCEYTWLMLLRLCTLPVASMASNLTRIMFRHEVLPLAKGPAQKLRRTAGTVPVLPVAWPGLGDLLL